jgi:hypothetical protein
VQGHEPCQVSLCRYQRDHAGLHSDPSPPPDARAAAEQLFVTSCIHWTDIPARAPKQNQCGRCLATALTDAVAQGRRETLHEVNRVFCSGLSSLLDLEAMRDMHARMVAAQEREANCRVLCSLCREHPNNPATWDSDRGWHHVFWQPNDTKRAFGCDAAALRARGEGA